MRRITFLMCAMLVALMATVAWAADVTGKWTGEMAGPDGGAGFALTFTFKQEGTKLTGTILGPQGDPIAISDGKVEGDKISFVVTIDMNGGIKITHDGTINGDEIKLTSKADGGQFPGGTITLKRVK